MPKHQFPSRIRRYWSEGGLYVIRDVYQKDFSGSGIRRQRMRSEYAVQNPNGSKKWVRCREGEEFAAIAPLRHRRAS